MSRISHIYTIVHVYVHINIFHMLIHVLHRACPAIDVATKLLIIILALNFRNTYMYTTVTTFHTYNAIHTLYMHTFYLYMQTFGNRPWQVLHDFIEEFYLIWMRSNKDGFFSGQILGPVPPRFSVRS